MSEVKKSQVPGVYWRPKRRRWIVALSIYGFMTSYGTYENRFEAERKAIKIRRENPKFQCSQRFKIKGISEYRGVTRFCSNSIYIYWQSRISINKKCIYLGTFKKEKLAAIAYNAAARLVYGDEAILNEVRM